MDTNLAAAIYTFEMDINRAAAISTFLGILNNKENVSIGKNDEHTEALADCGLRNDDDLERLIDGLKHFPHRNSELKAIISCLNAVGKVKLQMVLPDVLGLNENDPVISS
jgi:hypothetical protein